MSRTPRIAPLLGLLGLVILLMLPAPAVAEDDGGGRTDGPLRMQIFRVGGLTSGISDYIPPIVGASKPGWDLENPLFGARTEEDEYPVGSVDDLVEYIKTTFKPRYWNDTDGADIVTLGEHGLVVRAHAHVLPALRAHLMALQSNIQAVFTLDAILVDMESTEALALVDPATGVIKNPDAVMPGILSRARHQVRATGRSGQRAVAWDGAEQVYIADYDVEVAQKAKIADPIVGVMNLGLAVSASMRAVDGTESLLVHLQGGAAILDKTDAQEGGSPGTTITTPMLREIQFNSQRSVPADAWVLADAGAGSNMALFMRASRRSEMDLPSALDGPLPLMRSGSSSRLVAAMHPVHDLSTRVQHTMVDLSHLWPSNYTPPGSPELPEPAPAFPTEALPDLLASLLPEGMLDGRTSMQYRSGVLLVRNTPDVQKTVMEALGVIREQSLWRISVQAHVIEMPSSTAASLLGQTQLMNAAERAALLASPNVTLIHRSRLDSPQGSQRHLEAGRRRSYVRDYEVEIAEDAVIANPVVGSYFEGLQLMTTPHLSAGGSAALLGWILADTEASDAMPVSSTPHGMVGTPRLVRAESHGSAQVPFDRSVIASLRRIDGQRVRMILLTPRFIPAPE